jgi:hypothetical protein
VRDRRRYLAAAGVLLTAIVAAACNSATSATATPDPTPTPTPAGGEHTFRVGDPPLQLVVTLPPGWEGDATAVSRAGEGGELAISAWAVSAVYADPCSWQGTNAEVGPTVAELVAALTTQPTRRARDATVQVAGLVAHRVFMSVPQTVDFATCDDGEFRSWIGSSGAEVRTQSAPGETDEVYVLDVAGRTVVLDASYVDASTDELAEIHHIIGSLSIPEPSPSPASSATPAS